MKLIEEYNIQQIKICGSIIGRLLENGESIDKFVAFTKYIKTRARPRELRNFNLRFVVEQDKELSNDEFLTLFGYETLKAYRRMKRVLHKRKITADEFDHVYRELRNIDWKFTHYGSRST